MEETNRKQMVKESTPKMDPSPIRSQDPEKPLVREVETRKESEPPQEPLDGNLQPQPDGSPSGQDQPQLQDYGYYCTTCGKPYYQYPYQYPQQYHQEYKTPSESSIHKKFLHIPIWIWVFILIGAVIISCLIVGIIMIPQPNGTSTFSTEAIIIEEGHFMHSLGFLWGDMEVTIDISSEGGRAFDVYIMDWDQYNTLYGPGNQTPLAFSVLYSSENITQVYDVITLEGAGFADEEYFLVVDNRNTEITPNDAIPEGTITVDIEISTTDLDFIY
jgi:hypothetical protein